MLFFELIFPTFEGQSSLTNHEISITTISKHLLATEALSEERVRKVKDMKTMSLAGR